MNTVVFISALPEYGLLSLLKSSFCIDNSTGYSNSWRAVKMQHHIHMDKHNKGSMLRRVSTCLMHYWRIKHACDQSLSDNDTTLSRADRGVHQTWTHIKAELDQDGAFVLNFLETVVSYHQCYLFFVLFVATKFCHLWTNGSDKVPDLLTPGGKMRRQWAFAPNGPVVLSLAWR